MMCGGIQKESRPSRTCHWMSHCTPQPAISLEARSVQRAARRRSTAALGRRSGGSGGCLDSEHLHVEEEGLAREGVVEVEHDRRVLDLLDGYRPRLAGSTTRRELGAHLEPFLRDGVLRHLLLSARHDGPVAAVLRRHHHLLLLAGAHVDELTLETRDDLALALHEDQRGAALVAVQHLTPFVLECVL